MLAERLSAHAPPGIRIDSVSVVPPGSPAVQTQVEAAEYVASSLDVLDAEAVSERCAALLSSDSISRERRGKSYDLRPLVEALTAEDTDGRVRLHMTLRAKEGATGRPDEVLFALELDPTRFEITRVRLRLSGVD